MPAGVRPHIATVERRLSDRKPSVLMATAVDLNGRKLPCCVKDVSDTGVMLEFIGSFKIELGNKFDVTLSGTNSSYKVKLMWRKERQVGVLFCL